MRYPTARWAIIAATFFLLEINDMSNHAISFEGTPIGVNCRLCERENCSQRAEPPITRTLILDETTRRVSSFAFSNAREL